MEPLVLTMATWGSSPCADYASASLALRHAVEAVLTVATAVALAPRAEAVAKACMHKQECQMAWSFMPEQLQDRHSHWPVPAQEPEDQLQQTDGAVGWEVSRSLVLLLEVCRA